MINKCIVSKYEWDEKNSEKGEAQSYDSPGYKPTFAINIKEIIVEEKTILLKKLLIGSKLEFKISQEIEIDVPNYKSKEYEAVSFEVTGDGSGIISELSAIDLMAADDDYQEMTIKLEKGFAESLS
jgi:hypothetical protein